MVVRRSAGAKIMSLILDKLNIEAPKRQPIPTDSSMCENEARDRVKDTALKVISIYIHGG